MQNMARAFVLLISIVTLSLTAFAQYFYPSVAEEQDYAFANGLLKDQLYSLALTQFEQFITKYPESIHRPTAAFLAVECLFFDSRYEDAAQRYKSFLRDYPGSPLKGDALFRLGESYYHNGRFDEARGAFADVLEGYGDRPFAGEAAYWIGQCAVKDGDDVAAVKYLSMSAENYPSNPLADYALYSLGWIWQRQGRCELAVRACDQLAASYPKSKLAGTARVRQAECLITMKSFEQASTILTAALPSLSDSADVAAALFALGEARYGAGQYPEARAAYLQFLARFPSSPQLRDAKYSLAWTYLKTHEIEKAVPFFTDLTAPLRDRAATPDSLSLRAAYDEGTALIEEKEYDAAVKVLTLVLKRGGKSALAGKARYQLGLIQFDRGAFTDAEGNFEAVAEGYTESGLKPQALHMLAESEKARGDFTSAVDHYTAFLESKGVPDNERASGLYGRGWAYHELDKHAEAAQDFEAYLKAYPDGAHAPDALFWLAESRYGAGQFSDAAGSYRRYLSKYPGGNCTEDARYGLAYSLFKVQAYVEAADAFEGFLKDFPGSKFQANATVRLADSYYCAKKFNSAAGGYRSVVRLHPGDESADYAQYQLGYALYHSGDVPAAIAHFNDIVAKNASSSYAPDAQYMVGWIYFHSKDYHSAINEFRKVLEKFPANGAAARAQYSIGDCYYNEANYDEAVKAYWTVIEKYPSSQYVADAVNGIRFANSVKGSSSETTALIDRLLKEGPPEAAEVLLLKKGEILAGEKQYAAAVQVYGEYLSKYQTSGSAPKVKLLLGSTLLAQRDTATAVKSIEAAAEGDAPVSVDAALLLGKVEHARGRLHEALRWCDRAAQKAGTPEARDEALYERSLVLRTLGRTSEAEAVMRETSGGKTNAAVRASIDLARNEISAKNYDVALERLRPVATSRTDALGAEAQYLVGEALRGKGNIQDAVTSYLRVKYVFGSDSAWVARALLKAADCYVSLGLKHRARGLLEEVVKGHAADQFGAAASSKLKGLR